MKTKVSYIVDRYEFTFVMFHRNNSEIGKLYYKPSYSSKCRLARVIKDMYDSKYLMCWGNPEAAGIYKYVVQD